jgi:hypothetical protein
MHSAPAFADDDAQDEREEPAILSYDQFRNHLGLLDWQRRRAEYERRDAAAMRNRVPEAVHRLG